jgi:hypothetical protein
MPQNNRVTGKFSCDRRKGRKTLGVTEKTLVAVRLRCDMRIGGRRGGEPGKSRVTGRSSSVRSR